jgi:hypothetical protein
VSDTWQNAAERWLDLRVSDTFAGLAIFPPRNGGSIGGIRVGVGE